MYKWKVFNALISIKGEELNFLNQSSNKSNHNCKNTMRKKFPPKNKTFGKK